MKITEQLVVGHPELQGAFATTLEAAQFLGLSKAMIHKMIRGEQMPARRYGRAIRIPTSWLHAEATRSVAGQFGGGA
jgi:excisionase family DNA binding protein